MTGAVQSVHSGRLERWLGSERIEHISQSMKGWYGPPIHLIDCPGSVRVCGDGDFIGPFDRGYFMSAADSLMAAMKRAVRGSGKVQYGVLNSGFASISDALSQASKGFVQYPGGMFTKTGAAITIGFASSLHKLGAQPAAGVAAAAAPDGTAYVDSDTGGMLFNNPAAGTLRLVGADVSCNIANMSLLLYDRIFGVAKTMNSNSTEAVTGVPTRYQSITPTAENYIGGNFGFIEVGLTALAAGAHNWTVCTYLDQGGNASTLPSVTGTTGAPVHIIDHPIQQWFAPLESGDTGIGSWTQMQCSATLATGLVNFVIGHPIGFMSFPVINSMFPFDWLTNRDLTPRIFDDAYLSFLEIARASASAATYSGRIACISTSS